MKIHVCLISAVLLVCSFSYAAEQTPRGVANGFYDWLKQYQRNGLPSEPALKRAEGYFSEELERLLHDSLIAQDRCVKEAASNKAALFKGDIYVGDEPLIFEGNIFVGNYEGFTKVISLTEKRRENEALVEAELEYIDRRAQFSDPYRWMDVLILEQQNGKWVIKDIDTPGKSASLLEVLKKYNSKEQCGA